MYDYSKVDPSSCEFIPIGAADDLGDGERLFVEIDDLMIVVFKIAGEYFAIADICDTKKRGAGRSQNKPVAGLYRLKVIQ